ncbi:MAG: YjbH domain-containing protein [Glaciecola sp.]
MCVVFLAGMPLAHAQQIATDKLVDVPTAQVNQDGAFRFGLSDTTYGKMAQIDYQATPWLDLGLSYLSFNPKTHNWLNAYENQSEGLGPNRYAYHAKTRLWHTNDARWGDWSLGKMAVQFGSYDFLDNASLRSHYLVATQQRNHTQWTLGWGDKGRFDGPFAGVSHTFYTPQYGHPLTLSVQYQQTPFGAETNIMQKAKRLSRPNQWQGKINWQFHPNISLATNVSEGHVGFGIDVLLDSQRPSSRYEPQYPQVVLAQPAWSETKVGSAETTLRFAAQEAWRAYIGMLLADIDLQVVALDIQAQRLHLTLANHTYPYWPDAIEQAHKVLSAQLPESIQAVDYVVQAQGHPVYRVHKVIVRQTEISTPITRRALRAITTDDISRADTYFVRPSPSWQWGIASHIWLPGQGNSWQYQQQFQINANWRLDPNWSLAGQLEVDGAESYTYISSDLTHTALNQLNLSERYLARYAKTDARLHSLVLRYAGTQVYSDKANNTSYHYQAFGGYVDNLWAGVGTEILRQNWQSRIAFGVSLARLTQRDINSAMGTTNKQQTVALVSAYWATPFYNMDVAVHAGQFLADDRGAKLQVRRTFANGWQFGIWAASTRLKQPMREQQQRSAGIDLSIPLDNLFGALSAYAQKVRYYQRSQQLSQDAGRMLDKYSGASWWHLRDVRYDVFTQGR